MIKLELPFVIPFKAPQKSGRRFYNPLSEEKKKAQWIVRSQYCGPILTGPLRVIFQFFIGLPASVSQAKKKELLRTYCEKRIDVSNLEKFIEDALTGIVYKDDSQIIDSRGIKFWAEKDQTTVCIWQLDEIE